MSLVEASPIPTDTEIAGALRRAWFPVARASDLTRPRCVRLLGETLVVFLTEEGEPCVVADRCGHRGGALSEGQVAGDRIVCPYHGWEWRGENGQCVRIPSLGDHGDIPPMARIAAYRAEMRWGLVWCCLERPAIPLPSPEALEGVGWTYGTGRPMRVRAGLRAATENFRDVAHFPFVHRSTMGHMSASIEPLHVERRGQEVFLTREYNAAEGDEGMWQQRMEFSYHAIAPGFVCLRMGYEDDAARFLLNAPSPHTAATDSGRPETTIFWVEGITPDYDAMTLADVLEAEAQVYEEDNPILDRLEPGEAPLDPTQQIHTLADRYTLEYRRAFVEFVRAANGVAPERSHPSAEDTVPMGTAP